MKGEEVDVKGNQRDTNYVATFDQDIALIVLAPVELIKTRAPSEFTALLGRIPVVNAQKTQRQC